MPLYFFKSKYAETFSYNYLIFLAIKASADEPVGLKAYWSSNDWRNWSVGEVQLER